MKTKKLAAALIMLALLLSACGREEAPQKLSGGTAAKPMPSTPEEEPFAEISAVDTPECAVTITGLEVKTDTVTVNALLENRSADKTYMFAADSAAVNSVITDPLFATEVAPGKKSNDKICLYCNNLKDNGETEYTDIELSFRVHDNDDWSADPVAKETVHIYPCGEEKTKKFSRPAQPSDVVLLDNDAVSMIATGADKDGLFGYTVLVYLVNKSDKEVMFSADEASINGFMADPFWACSVRPGHSAFTGISWADSTLEENGIAEVEDIELRLHVYDIDHMGADNIADEIVALHP